MALLSKRAYCDGYYCYGGYYSKWDAWGRWVVLAGIIIFFFLLYLAFSCFTARRRRRRGLQPYRGTGWFAGPAPPYNQHYYPNQPNNPAPPYTPHSQPGYGFYGGQQSGVEMQPQQPVYQPEPVYAPGRGDYSLPMDGQRPGAKA